MESQTGELAFRVQQSPTHTREEDVNSSEKKFAAPVRSVLSSPPSQTHTKGRVATNWHLVPVPVSWERKSFLCHYSLQRIGIIHFRWAGGWSFSKGKYDIRALERLTSHTNLFSFERTFRPRAFTVFLAVISHPSPTIKLNTHLLQIWCRFAIPGISLLICTVTVDIAGLRVNSSSLVIYHILTSLTFLLQI